jgi:hypothetical protein
MLQMGARGIKIYTYVTDPVSETVFFFFIFYNNGRWRKSKNPVILGNSAFKLHGTPSSSADSITRVRINMNNYFANAEVSTVRSKY